ncbi:DEAD/DEAH box helicase [Aliikangiella sp. IMCC44653]
MPNKPLTYKGPTNQLAKLLTHECLYTGLKLLLAEHLIDWQIITPACKAEPQQSAIDERPEETLIQGIFVQDERLLKTSITWPLLDIANQTDCTCEVYQSSTLPNKQSCEHIAALIIESKVRLERLPAPIKRQQTWASEWAYACHWLAKQSYDPFPNMARHRVVYLFNETEAGYELSMHKAYLTQANEYQRKAELDFAILAKSKLPKFVSETDKAIIEQVNRYIKANPALLIAANRIRVDFKTHGELLNLTAASQRLFWKSCHRAPIQRRFKAHVELSAESVSFNKSSNEILVEYQSPVNSHLDQLLEQKSLTQVTPMIELTSFEFKFPWQQQKSVSAFFDFAKIYFNFVGQSVRLQALLDWTAKLENLSHDNQEQLDELLQIVGGCLHQIDALPGVYQHFEQPIASQFDIADRVLQDDLSHHFVLLQGLAKEGWQVKFNHSFRLHQTYVDDWYTTVSLSDLETHQQVHPKTPTDWFELDIGVNIGTEKINLLPYIERALKSGSIEFSQNELMASQSAAQLDTEALFQMQLDDGRIIQLARHRLVNIVANLIELSGDKALTKQQRVKLPVSQFDRLLAVVNNVKHAEWQNTQWLLQKAQQLVQVKKPPKVLIPSNVNAELRSYQQAGVNWLQFLAKQNLNGILADDMGLGKTLQTLAHIQIEKNNGRLKAPVLVVAPTSLMGNWLDEINKFVADLSCMSWSGSNRHKLATQLASHDIIVTSYGVVARDYEILNQLNLSLIVLDEAQTIKNAKSKIAKILFQINATQKLCLSGTPLENHLGELWSLFHFLMPGFLASYAEFKRQFQVPIEKYHDMQRQTLLAKRIAPLMLRRTKQKVAKDLPSKTSINTFLELTEAQQDIYEAIRLSMLEQVQNALTESGQKGSAFIVGNALLRLRQVCCHISLVKPEAEVPQPQLSAKLNWLETKLPEMIENKQSVLIFSSFTSMLDKIAHLLEEIGCPFLCLTGKTRNRDALIKQFQAGEVPIFLISLKAGGAGLNLTKADTVIHTDPWWNPAAESQASDRAHRIGQDKRVFVYKLITRGTVEEKISHLQQRKSALADRLYSQNEKLSMQDIDWKVFLAPLPQA